MRSFTTAPIDLLWLMLVPLGICSFFVLRLSGRSGARAAHQPESQVYIGLPSDNRSHPITMR